MMRKISTTIDERLYRRLKRTAARRAGQFEHVARVFL